ncbi:hypothetical protein DFH11DRAFT_1540647 [Phellopilus nigrolimitatus]|nr:hypothetical protein DFH11DRAFT_1540647 [Phellopilus nigrolimitatus]
MTHVILRQLPVSDNFIVACLFTRVDLLYPVDINASQSSTLPFCALLLLAGHGDSVKSKIQPSAARPRACPLHVARLSKGVQGNRDTPKIYSDAADVVESILRVAARKTKQIYRNSYFLSGGAKLYPFSYFKMKAVDALLEIVEQNQSGIWIPGGLSYSVIMVNDALRSTLERPHVLTSLAFISKNGTRIDSDWVGFMMVVRNNEQGGQNGA